MIRARLHEAAGLRACVEVKGMNFELQLNELFRAFIILC